MSELNLLRNVGGKLRAFGKPVAFWLGLGFFIGWLSAPDFIRRYERSVAEQPSRGVPSVAPSFEIARQPIPGREGAVLGGQLEGSGPVEPAVLETDPMLLDREDALEEFRANVEGRRERGSQPRIERERVSIEAEEPETPEAVEDMFVAFGAPDFYAPYGGGLIPAGYPGVPDFSTGSPGPVVAPTGFSGVSAGGGGSDVAEPPAEGNAGDDNPGGGGGGGTVCDGDECGDEQPPGNPLATLLERIGDIIEDLGASGLDSGQLFVRFADIAGDGEIDAVLGVLDPSRREQYLEALDAHLVTLPEDSNALALASVLAASPLVADASPSFLRDAAADPLFGLQWALRNTGVNSGGLEDADIDAPEGWSEVGLSSRVGVAVIDTGFDVLHEDLKYVINGKANFVPGTSLSDHPNHGTAVAGALAALGNNAVGMSGVNRQWANLWVAKAGVSEEFISDAAAALAILGIPGGTKVANLSFASPLPNAFLCGALASRSDVLFAAAAGNDDSTTPNYPASCAGDNVVSVTASDRFDLLWSRSNRAPTVDVAAPGDGILTTRANAGYSYWTGTSMAAPIAAGVASLVALKYPELSPAAIRSRVKSSADFTLGTYPFRRVNLCRALGGLCLYLVP